ncbi:MAG: hypothetical protein ACRBN8_19865 [Nannocystales bacterium]
MSRPVPPPAGTTALVCGETVTAIDRGERMPLYEVRGRHGLRMVHWCWDAIAQYCWGWLSTSEMGLTEARAWHAKRFGRGRTAFHIDGEDFPIKSWANVGKWHVVLFLEGGRRVELDRQDNVVSDSWWKVPRAVETAPVRPALAVDADLAEDPDPVRGRVMLAGEAPCSQLSLFGGAA